MSHISGYVSKLTGSVTGLVEDRKLHQIFQFQFTMPRLSSIIVIFSYLLIILILKATQIPTRIPTQIPTVQPTRINAACHDGYSCSGLQLIQTESLNIECWGYQSCSYSPALSSANSALIECLGSFSCYQTALILLNSSTLECGGLFSCFTISNYIAVKSRYMGGSAELSFARSQDVRIKNSFYTGGAWVAKDSIIHIGNWVNFDGYSAGLNGIFYIDQQTWVWFRGRGRKSLYNITIICTNDGRSVGLWCVANSCTGVKFICNASHTFSANCDSADQSDVCPNGYVSSSFIKYKLPELDSASTFNNSIQLCENSNNSLMCDAANGACSNGDMLFNNGVICCNAYLSCSNLHSIKTNITFNNSIDNINRKPHKIAIRCD